jgi:7-cyano-7-deazaguanine reductase
MKSKHRYAHTPKPPHPASLSLLGRKVPQPASPDDARLEAFPNAYTGRAYTIRFDCPEFTSLCPITGQPDFGRITIEYVPNKLCLESKSLKLYLGSFRNHGSFAESITNRIRDDVARACRPRSLTVTADFTPRGGIGMRVVASYPPARSGRGAGG